MKNLLNKAFGDWSDVTGRSFSASTSIPLGVFGIVADDEKSKQVLLKSICDSVSARYFYVLGVE